jgi:hypothetical protein
VDSVLNVQKIENENLQIRRFEKHMLWKHLQVNVIQNQFNESLVDIMTDFFDNIAFGFGLMRGGSAFGRLRIGQAVLHF